MYGLTDNIVAGPAGHIVAGPAGSFVAGPAGTFTPAPGASVPVSGAGHVPFTEAGHVPITEGGHVPIDTSMATIPYRAPGGGMTYTEGSTQSAIPGPSAHVPVSQSTGGMLGVSGGGGGGVSGGGGGGGGITLGGAILGGGGISGGGGGFVSGAGAGGSLSGVGGAGGGAGGGGGAGMNYVSYSGPGMAPISMHVGQAVAPATGSAPTTPGTEGFTVSPGGHTIPGPTGYVHPPPASRFHGNPKTHVAHHPTRVENSHFNGEAYQPYRPSYVWPGRPEGTPPPPFLAGDYLKPSSFDPPHLVFSSERPGAIPLVDASVGARTQINETVNQSTSLDFSQARNVEYATSIDNTRNVTLDSSQTNTTVLSQPVTRETTVVNDNSSVVNTDLSVHQARTAQINVEEAARVVNLFFLDGASPISASLGQPLMARVA